MKENLKEKEKSTMDAELQTVNSNLEILTVLHGNIRLSVRSFPINFVTAGSSWLISVIRAHYYSVDSIDF